VSNIPASERCPNTLIPIVVLAGPTAVGKTELSLQIAEELDAEIIGVDSMQVYKYMDIGTAKPSPAERGRVPHHLIDYVDPAEEYNVSRFIQDAEEIIEDIHSRGKTALMTGGTGLYFKSFFEGIFELPEIDKKVRLSLMKRLQADGNESLYQELKSYDDESARRIHPNDTSRLIRALEIYLGTGKSRTDFLRVQRKRNGRPKTTHYVPIKFCLNLDRDQLYARINKRVDIMIDQGLQAEVEKLLDMGYDSSIQSMQSLGYRHMVEFLQGNWSWEDFRRYLARDTRRYAKRQLTWFRKDNEMRWVSPKDADLIMKVIIKKIPTYKQ